MNIFDKIITDENEADRRLGNRWLGSQTRRMEIMARMNPKGFPTPAMEPRVVRDGKTRGQLKRERRAVMREDVRAEQRDTSDELSQRAGVERHAFDNRFGSL